MKFFKLFCIIIIGIAISCSREVEFDLPSLGNEIVFNTVLITDSTLKVSIFHIADFGNPIQNYTYDGELIITGSNGEVDTLEEGEDGYYTSSVILQKEEVYSLEGISSDFPITACDTIPAYPIIEKISRKAMASSLHIPL